MWHEFCPFFLQELTMQAVLAGLLYCFEQRLTMPVAGLLYCFLQGLIMPGAGLLYCFEQRLTITIHVEGRITVKTGNSCSFIGLCCLIHSVPVSDSETSITISRK